MKVKGANSFAEVKLVISVMVLSVFVIVTTACGGVHGDDDEDVDPDIDGDVDTDTDVSADSDTDSEQAVDDLDRDGVVHSDDCNDCNSGMGPSFPDPCGNGFDEDCSGSDRTCTPEDADGDGYAAAPDGADCNDADPLSYPGAIDFCDDGVAQNCTLDMPCHDDADGDHFTADDDCDDSNPDVHPWSEEVCDPVGVDEDCDGQINEVSVDADRYGCIFDPALGQWQTIDFMTDAHHCGRCRNDCEATGLGTRCNDGVCE